MTVLTVAFNVISPIFVIVVLAAVVARHFDPNPRTLSTVIIYLFTPFLVLGTLAETAIQADELLQIMSIALLLSVIMSIVGYGLARLNHFDRRLESAFMMVIVLLNAGNYGLPLNEFAYGQEALQRAMIYYVTTSLIANTFGVFLASRGTASARQSLINVFKVPLVYGLIAGLLLNFTNTSLPLPLERVTALLGSAAVPAMLVLLGIQLNRALMEASFKDRLRPILLAAGTRLILGPLVMLVLVAIYGFSGVTRQAVLTQASMPTAVIAGVLAIQFDADADFTIGAILVSTVASIVTLSIVLTLLGAG
jgi:predicted permease